MLSCVERLLFSSVAIRFLILSLVHWKRDDVLFSETAFLSRKTVALSNTQTKDWTKARAILLRGSQSCTLKQSEEKSSNWKKALSLAKEIRDEKKKKESPPPTSLPHPHPPPQKNYWQLNEWNSRKRLESHAQSHNNGHSLSVQSELKKITSFSGRTFLIARNAQLLGKLVFCPYYSEPPVKLRSYIKF